MVVIDGGRYGFLDTLLRGHRIAMAASASREVQYWRDQQGVRHPIDVDGLVRSGAIVRAEASVDEMATLLMRMKSRSLGDGELESLAIVLARGERFCTADRAAIRAMRELGVGERWVSLEELLDELEPAVAVPEEKYRRG